ncbi:MAG: hypothetical protein L3J71_12015 [Victivallaceae bacterium]|nr:hypothetical protein [Victivallaceae bacterium]
MKKQTARLLKLTIMFTIVIAAILTYALPSYDDVLVVINDDSPQSIEIGNYFVSQRQVPSINVCHISMRDTQAGSDSPRMTEEEETKAIQDIKNYLVNNNLEDKINYIVLTRGIGYWATYTVNGTRHLFDLQLLTSLADLKYGSGSLFRFNPFYYYITENFENLVDYKFTKAKYGYYIVTRLDGPGGILGAKKQIDNSGYPAYHAYDKNNIKYLVIPPKFIIGVNTKKDEIDRRTNIKIIYPDMYDNNTYTVPIPGGSGLLQRDVAKEISFAYFDWVGWEAEFTKWYSNSEASAYYPSIYRGIEFLPGGIGEAFRSHPALTMNRHTGGMVGSSIGASDYVKSVRYTTGEDYRVRHLTNVAYDPINNWVWCGTGDSPFDGGQNWGDGRVSDEAKQGYAKHRGGGIGIFQSGTGDLVKHFSPDSTAFYTPDTSELNNARVVSLVYDKYDKLMWIAHYEGIQYYDLQNDTWHNIPELTNNFASAPTIYVDPFDTDKVYFAFLAENGSRAIIASQITDADTSIFEYSKSARTVKTYKIKDTPGVLPLITKTSADIVWLTWDKNLIKYKLSEEKILQDIDLQDAVKDETVKVDDEDRPILSSILYPRGLVSTNNTTGEKIVGVAFTTKKAVTADDGTPQTAYVLRIKETGESTSTNTLIHSPDWEFALNRDQWVQAMVVNPNSPDDIYIAFGSYRYGTLISESTDSGATWNRYEPNSLGNMLGMTIGENNKLYRVGGSYVAQQTIADFMLDGAVAVGGGMVHDSMYYDEKDHSGFVRPPISPNDGAYNGNAGEARTAQKQVESMMFMILDGYSIADARFGIFDRYPQHGSGGHNSHMLTMPPKSAPFAPRVDEVNTDFNVMNYNVIEIILDSPGLIDSMDGFFPSTINSTTVKLFDNNHDLVDPSTYTMVYNPIGNRITLTGNFTELSYNITLKCGNDGIKNIKGAPMVNTRENEFKDEISYSFSNREQSETNPPSVPTGLSQIVNPEAIVFSWNDSTDDSGIDHYKIVISDSSDFSTPVFISNPVSSNVSAAVWAVGVTNYWRVRAQDTEGNISGWSEVKTFFGLDDTTPPSIPIGLALVVNPQSIDFSWEDSTDGFGVTGYEIAVSDDVDFLTVAFTGSSVDSNISADVWTYDATNYWRVRALDAAGNVSGWSEVKTFTGPADTTPPSVPTDMEYDISSGNINFDWSDSTDASGIAGYEIKVVSMANWTVPVFTGTPTESNISTAIWDHGGFNHIWNVRAQDSAGNWSNWSSISFFTIPNESDPPSIPTGLTQTMNSKSINFNWDDSTDASGIARYELALAETSSFAPLLISRSPTYSNLLIMVPKYNTTLYWKVRATDTRGNISDWSEVASFTSPTDIIPPATPTRLKQVITQTKVDFDWSDSTDKAGITGYEIILSESSDFSTVLFSATTAISNQAVTGLKHNRIIYWKVRAIDKVANASDWSEIKTFTTPADLTAPPAPLGLAQVINPTTIDFTWNSSSDSSGVAGYEIVMSAFSSFSTILFSSSPTGTSASTDAWRRGATNYWKVRARDSVGNVGDWSEVQTFMGSAESTPPTIPLNLRQRTNDDMVNFIWSVSNDASGIANYAVALGRDNSFQPAMDTNGARNSMELSATSLRGYTQWRVRARDAAGNLSDWSAVKSIITAPPVNKIGNATTINLDNNGNGSTTGWIKNNEINDYYKFTPTSNGQFNIELTNLSAMVNVSIHQYDTGRKKYKQVAKIKPNKKTRQVKSADLMLRGGSTYYLIIKGNKAQATDYKLNIVGSYFPAPTDNNSFNKATPLTMNAGQAEVEGWIGRGDGYDYYSFTPDIDGAFDFKLTKLSTRIKLTIYQYDAAKKRYRKLAIIDTNKKTGLTEGLNIRLLAGANYYAVVETGDRGQGKYNTTYFLSIER